jgi:hypothetical protein
MKLSRSGVLILLSVALLHPSCTTTSQTSSISSESCAAGADPAALTMTPDSGITPPKVVRRVEPITPGHMKGREALAVVDAVIGVDGKPRHICFREGDPEWGAAVMAAFGQWEFEPATQHGQPVPVLFTLTTRLRP